MCYVHVTCVKHLPFSNFGPKSRFTRFSQVKLKLWEPFLCKTFNKFHIWLSMPVWPKFWVTSDHDDEFPPNWWFTQSRLHPLQVQSADPRTSLQIARAPTTIVTIVNQSQKNPVSASAMLTGKFLRIRKVFATRWRISGHFGKCPDTIQNIQIICNVSGWTGKFPDDLKSVGMNWNLSRWCSVRII